MTKRPRIRCIFCLGHENISREHVIPDWVRQIIPKKPHHGQYFILTQSVRSKLPPGLRPRHRSARVRQGHPISRKIKAVCKSCNTGWLSNLEEELKPRLRALILGEVLTLTPWDQRRLATWATKTAMTAEMLHPKSAAVTFREREYLRLHREPPKEFNVWVGHYGGSQYTTNLHHHSNHISTGTPTPPKAAVAPNTQATIINLGRLFLQIASSSFRGLQLKLKDEATSNLRRIWPPREGNLSWPPAIPLTDQDIDIILMGLDAEFGETI